MRSGDLRDEISILTRTETGRTSAGVPIFTQSTFAAVWAAVEPISGREYTQLRAGMSSVTVRFRIRYLSGITADMRVQYDGKVFDLVEPPINVRNENRELHLMCVDTARPTT